MIFLKLLIAFHVFGDFYLQTKHLNRLKKQNNWYLLLHVVLYLVPFLSMIWLNDQLLESILMVVSIFVSHFIVDALKIKLENKISQKMLFLIDQLFHIMVIIGVWFVLKDTFMDTTGIDLFLHSIELQVDFNQIVSVLLVFLLILRPTSIFIEMMLPIDKYDQGIEASEIDQLPMKEELNYGAFIGNLERVVIVLLGLLNLWSSIALVITAKSIARFKQLEDKKFAQKYLIGTLLSLSITLALLILFL